MGRLVRWVWRRCSKTLAAYGCYVGARNDDAVQRDDDGTAKPDMSMTADDERPIILVLLIHTQMPHRTAVVNLLDVQAWVALGYLIVCRDPFTVDEWRAWRRNNPEAA